MSDNREGDGTVRRQHEAETIHIQNQAETVRAHNEADAVLTQEVSIQPPPIRTGPWKRPERSTLAIR